MANVLQLSDIESHAIQQVSFQLSAEVRSTLQESFSFLNGFSQSRVVYGINTGFGPMAQYKIEASQLNALQYNLIRSHASGTGDVLDDEAARAVMIARINNFLQGKSGVSYDVVEKLVAFFNQGIIPEIYEHGGVGASGDLVQLAHLALNLIGEGYVRYRGQRRQTKEVLGELGLEPLKLQLRDGLGLINGTSCMSGIGAINLIYAYRLLNWAIASSAIIHELVEAYDDSISAGLNRVKFHEGQQSVAASMRSFLSGSLLLQKRDELFQDESVLNHNEFKKKIQEYYSVRCVPQILGPVKETLDYAKKVIENEINSTNDNPIVCLTEQSVFHGGNFHGDYVSLEMDKVKMVITKLTMLAERQLNFLLNNKLNDRFPNFLNALTPGFNFGLQGMQFTATSTTAESQMLSNPMYVHSIPNNNDNQDIVSMGTNSAVIARKVIDNGFQVMAIHVLAICQALDLLKKSKYVNLSPKTTEIHHLIRSVVPAIREDVPQFENIRSVTDVLRKTVIDL